jgi:hypothetical protein
MNLIIDTNLIQRINLCPQSVAPASAQHFACFIVPGSSKCFSCKEFAPARHHRQKLIIAWQRKGFVAQSGGPFRLPDA